MTHRLMRLLACFALPLSIPNAWSADDLLDTPIERLLQMEVEGASRFAQPLSEAPSSASVITAEDIRRFGFRNLGEALQSVRGVYTTNERDYTYLGIRGFARPGDYNSRMLLLADGKRLNDPLYNTAPIGYEAPLEMDWIKRLEFVPGPASALYGGNAVFGVANAMLWSGGDLNGSRLTADIGSGNMAHLGWISGRRTEDGNEWVAGISAYQRRGEDLYFREFDAPGIGNGIAQGLDGERYLKAFAKLNSGSWQVDANYSARKKDVPTAYYGTLFNTPGNFILDQYGYASVSHAKALSADWNQNLRLHLGGYQFAGEYVYAGLTNRDEALATWWGLNYLLTYSGLKNHKLLIGADAQRNQHADQRNFDIAPAQEHLNDRRSGNEVGIFAQDEWRIGQQWMTNLGIRLDRLAGFSATSPRAALIYHPVPEASLKLMYGKAFRPPNNYERFYNDGNILQKANPDLLPERITTHELSADYALTPALRLAGSYYHYRLENLVDQIVDPVDGLQVFINRPPIHAHGVELEAESLFRGGIRLKGSIARQMVEQTFADTVNSPRLIGKLQADGPLGNTGWILGFSLRALDPRLAVKGSVPGHAIGNLVVSQKKPGPAGEWSFGIYNLSGQRYLDPASAPLTQQAIPQDGRQFRLTWKVAY